MKPHSLSVIFIILMFCPLTARVATLEVNNYTYTSGKFEQSNSGFGTRDVDSVRLMFWNPDATCRITRIKPVKFRLGTPDGWRWYETPAWNPGSFRRKGNYWVSPSMAIPYIHNPDQVRLSWEDYSGGAFELQCSREQPDITASLLADSVKGPFNVFVSTGKVFSSTKESLIINVKDEVELSEKKPSIQLLTGNRANFSQYVTITQNGKKTNKFVLTSSSGETTTVEYVPSTGKLFWADYRNLPAGEYKGQITVSVHFP
ncbi:hypothetical protein IM076_004668 [Escherichia coli]|nr:hypothetical protein [Escherichia coli]EGJ4563709.1 hypothetical protein [Escherichia coli]